MDCSFSQKLCDKIEISVGQLSFKSEEFLDNLSDTHLNKKTKSMHDGHVNFACEFASSEIRLALTLRVLASPSCLCFGLLCVCGYSSIYRMFHHVAEKWTCNDDVIVIARYKI